MAEEHYFNLRHSESVIANMAATIFASYVQTIKINEVNEEEYIKKAVNTAIKLAAYTDKIVKSDEEWIRQDGDSSLAL